MCSHHRCGYFRRILDKTINCYNISVDNLKLYEELHSEDDFSSFYPLTLKVTNSEIPLLPTSTFRNLKNLTVLFMENVKLKTIMPAAFNYLDQLKEIYLGQNELTTISDGVFNTLTVLEKLDLSRNRIETITDHAFVGTSLRYLNLCENNISELQEAVLNSLTQLNVLDISYNSLKDINSFHNLQVHSFDISHNSMETVDFEVFQKASLFLDFSFNNITQITNFNSSKASKILLSHNRIRHFERNENVEVLDLSYNDIDAISSNLLGENLVEFHISFNSISSFNSDTFYGLYKLTHLYLDNNNLTSIPNSCFKDLSSLTHLNLSGNRLTQFTFGTFDNLINLQVLDISNNHFKELPQYVLHSLGKLTYLFLQNNEISSINANDLIVHLHQLRKINLNNNTWSCLKLVDIVQTLKRKDISFSDGNSWEESNIHGIKCYETFTKTDPVDISTSEINLYNSKLNSFFNEDFTKSFLYKYFNQDFKESEFFKYLESLKKSTNSSYTQNIDYNVVSKLLKEIKSNPNETNGDFKNTEMYNYFNRDFRNTSFFKYLENLRFQPSKLGKADEDKLEEIANSLKIIANELEKKSNASKTSELFGKSEMYNYFNKEFKTSNFFKYLESLNTRIATIRYSDNIEDSAKEKFISPYEKTTEYPSYTGLLSVISLLLLIVTCALITMSYHQIFHLHKYAPKKEEVELI